VSQLTRPDVSPGPGGSTERLVTLVEQIGASHRNRHLQDEAHFCMDVADPPETCINIERAA
jgi:hypothetical protein